MLKTLPIRSSTRAIAALLAISLSALPIATLANGVPPEPTPSPSSAPIVHWNGTNSSASNSTSDSSSRSRAGAAANSSSSVGNVGGGTASAAGGSAQAAGGAGGSVGDASSGATINDNASSNYKALAIGLPPPSTPAPLPSARDCIGTSNWTAAGGWSFASGGKSDQAVIVECMVAQQIHVLRLACQFDAANKLQARLVSKLIDFTIEPAADVNLTEQQCRDRLAPAPLIALAPPPAPIVFEAPAAAACPVPAPAKPRTGIARKSADSGCKK